MNNIDILTYHHYIQYLDLSNNNLTSLTPLGQLPFLMYLDASRNLLTEILDFKAPFYLTYVNYSYNKITEMRDLSDFWSIVCLDLSRNGIKKISGLETLKYMRDLNLAQNNIECIENLNKLNIQSLYLQKNKINKFEMGVLQTLRRLINIDVSYNQLDTLKLFRDISNLQEINMMANQISCLMELNYLRTLPRLSKLDLKGNPVCNKSDFYRVGI